MMRLRRTIEGRSRSLRNGVLRLLVAVLVFAGVGVLASPAPAAAASTCAGYVFFRSEPFGRWLGVEVNNGARISASGTVQGWYQAFELCRDSSWPYNRRTLKAAANGRFLTVNYNSGRVVQATNTFEGGRELFDFDYQYISSDGIAVYSIRHVESGRYLGVASSGGLVRADATFVGWYQAFAWVA
jgi:hypothetical protein